MKNIDKTWISCVVGCIPDERQVSLLLPTKWSEMDRYASWRVIKTGFILIFQVCNKRTAAFLHTWAGAPSLVHFWGRTGPPGSRRQTTVCPTRVYRPIDLQQQDRGPTPRKLRGSSWMSQFCRRITCHVIRWRKRGKQWRRLGEQWKISEDSEEYRKQILSSERRVHRALVTWVVKVNGVGS